MPVLSKLGNRIRKHRLERKLTLEQLSKKAGLSKSFLSQIERGLAEPSITSLKKIAKQFGFSVVNFFLDEGDLNSGWRYTNSATEYNNPRPNYIEDVKVVRVDKRKKLALPGSKVMYDLLTPDMKRKLEVMYMRVREGQTSGDEPMDDPPGEKIGVILKGSLEFTVGSEVYELNQGDSIYFPANFPHSWRAREGDFIEVIWILTPPSF
jgi:transcriptional regulator with XRE-family HTH domain